jgi:plasmid stabilization system protein ParE
MPKRLEWSGRSRRDVERIEEFYSLVASPDIADMARDAIVSAALRLVTLPALHRSGKGDTREYVMKRFPYTIIYRTTAESVRIVRVLHQARKYFN